MIEPGQRLLVFFETDCPTCRLIVPYLNKLAKQSAPILGISQDSEFATQRFIRQASIVFPLEVDHDLRRSRAYDPSIVPALFLIGADDVVIRSHIRFDKDDLNALATEMGYQPVADAYDGAPARKPGFPRVTLGNRGRGHLP